MNNNYWIYSSHHLISISAPHKLPNTDYVKQGEAWNDFPNAVCAVWASEFDEHERGKWWYVILDHPLQLEELKAKRRYEINKGIKNFETINIKTPLSYTQELYEVYCDSATGYKGEAHKKMDISSFTNWLSTIGKTDEWGGMNLLYVSRSRETGKFCGFASITLYPEWAAFPFMKTTPSYEKKGVNAALIYGMLDDIKEYLSKDGYYISDGSRTIYHQTLFQDYLEKYFQFRKAYCRLNIEYNPRYKWIVKSSYPFRGLIMKLKKIGIIRGLLALFEMEEIARTYK